MLADASAAPISASAQAVIVAPSIVGDRYIQLTPVYESGPKLRDGATLSTKDTSVPLELDQIYDSLNVVHRLHEGELAKALNIQLGFNANDGD